MPIIFGTEITDISYDEETGVLTVTGEAFGINEYAGISNIETSPTGAGSWTAVDSIDSWSDTEAVGTYSTPLASGIYDVRITSSDGETYVSTGGIFISSDEVKRFRFEFGFGF